MDPSSPGSETLSAVSGTTLARALIANSFVLSSGERMNSYPRSAISRQDSATLPRELPPLPLGFGVGDIQRSSSVPPVPPLQSNALLEQRRSCISGSTMMGMKPSSVGLHTNTENASSEYSSTDVYPLTPPELVLHSGQPRRISPISEVPSASNAPMSLKVIRHQDVTSICREIRTRVESEESDDPHPASDILSTPPSSSGVPKPSWSTTDSSQTDPSSPVDHSLDEYSFVPPGLHTAMLSSGSDSSASFIMSSPIKRNDSNIRRRPMKAGAGGTIWRGMLHHFFVNSNFVLIVELTGTGTRTRTPYQRNKKQIRLLPIVHSSEPQSVFTPTMMASSISRSSLSHLPLVPSSAVPAGHLEMPPTAREGIDQDYGEFFDYAITVSPDLGSSSHYTSSSSAGYQTFPETPMFSPALFSPDYLRAQAPTLRTQRPPLPRSATLPSPRECIAWGKSGPAKSTVNSTQSQNEDVGSPRRPQSIASLNYTTPSPFSGSEPLGSSPLSASSTSSIQSSFSQSSTPLTTPPCTTDSVTVAASVPLSESTTNSPHRLSFSDDFSSSTLSSVDSQSPSRARTIASPPNFVTSFLPTLAPTPSPPLPPISLRTSTASPLSQSHAPTSCSLSFPSVSASFVDPPSYRTVVPDDQGSTKVPPSDVDHPALLTQPNPVQERDRELPFQIPFSLYPGGRTRGRRPPLPIGPRRPSGPARPLGSFVPGFRERFASESAVAGNNSLENTPTWHKLYEAASKPLPKFQTPPAKWRGLTVEAAQWTLTSSQLQNVISRAIKQSAEGSSIRLLCLETLDGEIAEETHRLEMLHTDIKFRYKALVRKRWQLLGALAGHLEDAVTVGTASRTLEELADVTLEHDQLADELHCTAEQLSQLKSLRDIHHSSALAMALRKVNSAFLHQVEEKQKLHERIEALEAERDEGWKQAEDVAMEYDRMVEASRGPATRATNRRSAHVSAVRKSSIRRSKAGLRLSSSRRSSANNASGTRCSMPGPRSTFEDIPAVPPIPLSQSSATTLTSGSYYY